MGRTLKECGSKNGNAKRERRSMKWLAKNRLRDLVGGALGALFLTAVASAGGRPAHPYRYSVVDIPVSLAVGSVRTPEFSPRKTSWHWILLQVERPLPPSQMRCMVGVEDGTDRFQNLRRRATDRC